MGRRRNHRRRGRGRLQPPARHAGRDLRLGRRLGTPPGRVHHRAGGAARCARPGRGGGATRRWGNSATRGPPAGFGSWPQSPDHRSLRWGGPVRRAAVRPGRRGGRRVGRERSARRGARPAGCQRDRHRPGECDRTGPRGSRQRGRIAARRGVRPARAGRGRAGYRQGVRPAGHYRLRNGTAPVRRPADRAVRPGLRTGRGPRLSRPVARSRSWDTAPGRPGNMSSCPALGYQHRRWRLRTRSSTL